MNVLGWIFCLYLVGSFTWHFVGGLRKGMRERRERDAVAARQKALDEAVTRGSPIATTTEVIAPPGSYELAMQEHLRFVNEVNEWNRLVTTTPPVRFQPVNWPEMRQ